MTIQGLDDTTRELVAQIIGANPVALLALDPVARGLLGLPTEDAPLLQEIEGLLLASGEAGQLQAAYTLLNNWDEAVLQHKLEILQAQIATIRTDFMGQPIPTMQQVAQRYYNDLAAYHEKMLALREQVFVAEGDERQQALAYLERISPDILDQNWQIRTLPELVAILEANLKSGHFEPDPRHSFVDDNGTFRFHSQEDYEQHMQAWYLHRDVEGFIHDYHDQDDADLLKELALFAGSVLFEPMDWVVTGASIVTALAAGRWAAAGFDLATLFLPGAWSRTDELWDAARGARRLDDAGEAMLGERWINNIASLDNWAVHASPMDAESFMWSWRPSIFGSYADTKAAIEALGTKPNRQRLEEILEPITEMEVAVGLDGNGNILFISQGEYTVIDQGTGLTITAYAPPQGRLLERFGTNIPAIPGIQSMGITIIHNHPSGSTISWGDIEGAITVNASEIIAIGRHIDGNVYRYSIQRPQGGWQSLEFYQSQYSTANSMYLNNLNDSWLAGDISDEIYNIEIDPFDIRSHRIDETLNIMSTDPYFTQNNNPIFIYNRAIIREHILP